MSSITLQSAISAIPIYHLSRAQSDISSSVAALSSGKRFASTGEDVASVSVAASLSSRVSSLRAQHTILQRNIAMLQQMDGALNQVGDMLQRQMAITTLSQNGALGGNERAFYETEFGHLIEEIDRVANNTMFGEINILNGGKQGLYWVDNASLAASQNQGYIVGYNSAQGADLELTSLTASSSDPSLSFLNGLNLLETSLTDEQKALLATAISENRASLSVEVGNLQQAVDGDKAYEPTTATVNITDAVRNAGISAASLLDNTGALKNITVDAMNDSGRSLIRSERTLLQLSRADNDESSNFYFSAVNVTSNALYEGANPTVSTGDSAKAAAGTVQTGIHNFLMERARVGAALSALDKESNALEDALQHMDAARALFEDTDIAKTSTEYAVAQVKLNIAVAIIAQTNELNEDAMETIFEEGI